MANGSVISFQRGQKANLNSVSKIPGQILFVLNSDNTGSIYYDDSSSARYRMSYDLKDTATTFSVSSNPVTTTTGRVYPVALDKDGYLAVNVPWVNYSVATTTTAGLMSAADKSKLDGIAAGAKTGTVTSVATGTGLTGGPITTTGTIKVKLASETALTYQKGKYYKLLKNNTYELCTEDFDQNQTYYEKTVLNGDKTDYTATFLEEMVNYAHQVSNHDLTWLVV